MKSEELSIKHFLTLFGAIAGLILIFFLACIQPKLYSDFSNGKIESLTMRLGMVVLASLFLAWRLKSAAKLVMGRGRTVHDLLITVLFVSVLFFPVFSQFSHVKKSVKKVVQSIEKDLGEQTDRTVSLLKQFPAAYENYTETKFELSKWFVYLDALVKVYGLGVSPNTNVAVGKNGFYFEGWGARKVETGIVENFDNIADYMGQIPMSDDELRQWKRVLEERKYWLRERGSEFVFVLAPTKALVYPEYLPSSLKKAPRGMTRYEQLSGYLNDYGNVNFVDVLPALKRTKQLIPYPLLFYKTDFHWNYFGAFTAYEAIVSEMRGQLPSFDFTTPRLADFTMDINKNWAHRRFMNLIGLPVNLHMNEHYITMIPASTSVYDSARDIPPEGIHDVYPREEVIGKAGSNQIKIRALRNPGAKIGSILLLGDSFFEKCVYFFSAEARRLLNYRTIVNFPSELFQYEQPDIVIQEILNMYVLRAPPKNPPGFTDSYLVGKFADGRRLLYLDDGSSLHMQLDTADNTTKYALPLELRQPPVSGEVRIAKISVDKRLEQPVTVSFLEDTEEETSIPADSCIIKTDAIYCLIPSTPVKELVLSAKTTAGNAEIRFASLEVRSDLR